MSRLKIVDQHALTVPYHFENLGITIAYNGEVYNWKQIRSAHPGIAWQTECDVEALAVMWREQGPACLHELNGMWGFILVDHKLGEVYIVRDRAGEKPVYYAQRGTWIYVASEIKALPVALEPGPCEDTDMLEYDFRGSTPFKNVYALEPGHYIKLDKPQTGLQALKPQQWWHLPTESVAQIQYSEALEELEPLLIDAIKLRADTEVPFALQLSGGLDSSIIQAVVKSENLYCVTFPEPGFDHASAANLGMAGARQPLNEITFGFADLQTALPELTYHLDTPATWTAVCQWFMLKQMRQDGFKITLSGEGADELFGGYSRYRLLHWLQKMHNDPLLVDYNPLITHMFGNNNAIMGRLLDRKGTLASQLHAIDTVSGHAEGRSLVTRMATVDFYTTMQVLLRMPDRMSAAFGMENRSPFLDYRLMEFAAQLPAAYKVTDTRSKPLLRDIAARLGVHDAIVNEKTKRGLAIPWPVWAEGLEIPGGSRGAWDRKGFAYLMAKAWKDRCCRGALCSSCETQAKLAVEPDNEI